MRSTGDAVRGAGAKWGEQGQGTLDMSGMTKIVKRGTPTLLSTVAHANRFEASIHACIFPVGWWCAGALTACHSIA